MSEFPQSSDRFEIIRIVGKGGMGTVYLARDKRLGRNVALKVLNAEGLESDERRARFLREARAAAAIRHPNVATIYEVGDAPGQGQSFIAMEYCEGETLAQRMRRRPLDSAEFLNVARQIAAGLAAAHASGVVHRDIKPANVMLEPNGLVKILDFGLARLVPREYSPAEKLSFESTSGHFFGTLHYLAPEQARGQQADARSDLFSLGIVLYQMASGHLPFNAEAPLAVLEKIRDSEPEPFTPLDPKFPPAATKIIRRLLQKNPVDRYPTAAELLADLEAIESPTVAASVHHSRSMLGRTRPGPRWGRLALIIAIFVAGAAAIYYAQQRGGKPQQADQSRATPLPPIRSMAVLPLDNLAKSQSDEFLSVGLADALVTKLQQIPQLQVRPTSAILQFRDEKIDAREASQKLQVEGVLEGHFLSAGDLVRVNLQLTDARSGYSVWADSIDGKRGDLLKLIDDVSSRTLNGLNQKLGVQRTVRAASEARSSNPKAYEQYLRARAMSGSVVQEDFQAELAALKRAIELDPNFAAAYAELATSISVGVARSLVTEPDAIQKAEWYARQAVRLDPNLAAGHLALGRVFVRYPGRYRESVRETLAAIRLNPNETQSLWTMTTYFVSTGDLQNAHCVGERLVRIDPSSNEAKTRGYWSVNAVDPEGALRDAQVALASRETALIGHDLRGVAFVLLGNLSEAQREADAAAALAPSHYLPKSLRAMIAAARQDRGACEQALRTFENDANRNHWAAIRVAQCYAKLGDRNQALKWLRRAVDLGHHSWYALVKHPWMQGLQSDPEFQTILSGIKADLDDVRDDVIGVYQLICP